MTTDFASFSLIFQSTLPRGERPKFDVSNCGSLTISIHAPARGATITHDTLFLLFVDFNPRSREGSDLFRHELQKRLLLFQSTLPRGERQGLFFLFRHELQFQSTLPRGERHSDDSNESGEDGFQSTLPRGERRQHHRARFC